MQGPKFKFYIKNKEGLYYFVDDLDTVQLSVTKKEIVHAPKGWQSMLASLITNEKYKGNFKKVSTPFQFVLDGKKIVDYIAVYEGTQGYAEFIIERQVPDDFSYTLFFSGTLDYADKYSYGDVFSVCNIREINLIDILDAKENVVYEIPLTDTNSGFIQIDGINLHYKTLYTILDGFGSSLSYYTGRHIVEFLAASNENQYANETKRTKYTNHSRPDIIGTNQPFYEARRVPGGVEIKYDFKVFVKWTDGSSVPGPGSQLRYDIYKTKADGSFQNNVIYTVIGQDNIFGISYLSGKLHHIEGTVFISVEPGDNLYLCCNPSGMTGSTQPCAFTYQDQPAEFIVDTYQRTPATLHRFIYPWKIWQELVYKATDGQYGGISQYLFLDENRILIPGSALRKDDVISVKTTISKFLKYCYVNHLAVLSDTSGNNGVLDYLGNCFLPDESMDVGEIADFNWEFSKEHIIGSIKVGYENMDLGVDDQVNGKDEFNQTNDFTTGQENIKQAYEIVSPYIASIYAIEKMRVNFGNRKTTDNKNDNDVFIIDAEKGTNIQYYSGVFETIAPNLIKLSGTIPALPNGTQFTISGAASNNGVFTVTNTSYITVGYTVITVAETVTSASALTGLLHYFDANVMQPRRPAYASITGVLDPATVYNTELSPMHLLLLHAPVISGGVYNSNANAALDTLKFQSGDKNVLLSVSMDNITFIKENADVLISTLPMPFYIPVVFNFMTDYREDLFTYLDGPRKYQHIGFTKKGIKLNGYPVDVSGNPDSNEKQKWKLLCAASTNLINII